MYISHVVIKNFRALEDIHSDFSPLINVIVGPNAIGKTTVLHAIRLVKALLAPRTVNEAQQTLISLNASSPHFPQRLFFGSLARDPKLSIEIKCTYSLTNAEIALIEKSTPQLVQNIVQSRVGQGFANPAALIQFLNSPVGIAQTTQATSELQSHLKKLRDSKKLILGIIIDPSGNQITAIDPMAGAFIAFLDQLLPPYISLFSYFPADRALPVGEVAVQLGAADTQQQIEAHNSQPQLKYTRMKNIIFNSVIMGDDEKKNLLEEFERIFSGILRGRKIASIGVNDLGLLSVVTEDIVTKRQTEIDALSSGEKNLVLTFLLIAKAISHNGIALFDEPELHLNPSVCRDVLEFMLNAYAKPRNIQFIICTHSPEILSGAFTNEECSLYHIRSSTDITKVGRNAMDEYSEALKKLGTSVGENLLYEGTVLVEGDDDVAFLEDGFSELLKRYKIKDRGGRKEVEKTARKLQELEAKGEEVSPILIVFDKDDEPTDLENSKAVRVLQWPMRSIENYLIDIDVVTELLKKAEITNKPVLSGGDTAKLLREIALTQLDEIATRKVYEEYKYLSPGLRKEDVEDKPLSDMAAALYKRASSARTSLTLVDEDQWKNDFTKKVEQEKIQLEHTWDSQWKELCDGKKLFADLQKRGILKVHISVFKKKIIQLMKERSSDNWKSAERLLKKLLDKNPS